MIILAPLPSLSHKATVIKEGFDWQSQPSPRLRLAMDDY